MDDNNLNDVSIEIENKILNNYNLDVMDMLKVLEKIQLRIALY